MVDGRGDGFSVATEQGCGEGERGIGVQRKRPHHVEVTFQSVRPHRRIPQSHQVGAGVVDTIG